MTLSAEEIQEGTRLLGVLDQQIALLKQRHARQFSRFLEVPSRDQFFMLASDAEGVLRLGTDATFVAEKLHIHAFGYELFEELADPTVWPGLPDVMLRDQSAGRTLTEAQQVSYPAVADLVAGVPPAGSVLVQSEFGSPLVTLPFYGGGLRIPPLIQVNDLERLFNWDFMREFPVELEIPRGGVVSVRYRNQRGVLTGYPFVLVGYKVY
jgi:hypothetical protein